MPTIKPNEWAWIAAAAVLVFMLEHWYVHRNDGNNGQQYVMPRVRT